jgi:DNA-binding transcriptional ArsR family regulator
MKTMPKVVLDKQAFKNLASESRLDILKTLDGKKLTLKEISDATHLHKATLHEHLTKLFEAGLVKRHERKGRKRVYYHLSWRGATLLHPENSRVVVLFSATFVFLLGSIVGIFAFVRDNLTIPQNEEILKAPTPNDGILSFGTRDVSSISGDPILLYLALACVSLFLVFLLISVWRYRINKTPQL